MNQGEKSWMSQHPYQAFLIVLVILYIAYYVYYNILYPPPPQPKSSGGIVSTTTGILAGGIGLGVSGVKGLAEVAKSDEVKGAANTVAKGTVQTFGKDSEIGKGTVATFGKDSTIGKGAVKTFGKDSATAKYFKPESAAKRWTNVGSGVKSTGKKIKKLF